MPAATHVDVNVRTEQQQGRTRTCTTYVTGQREPGVYGVSLDTDIISIVVDSDSDHVSNKVKSGATVCCMAGWALDRLSRPTTGEAAVLEGCMRALGQRFILCASAPCRAACDVDFRKMMMRGARCRDAFGKSSITGCFY